MSLGVNNTLTIEIKLKEPTSGMNAISVRLDVPSMFTIQSFSPVNGSEYVYLDPCDTGKSYYQNNSICFDVAKLGGIYFSEGEELGAFTVKSISEGTGVMAFSSGTELVDANTLKSYAVTGNIATYSISSETSEYTADPLATDGENLVVNVVQNEVSSEVASDSNEENGNFISKLIEGEDGKVEIAGTQVEAIYVVIFLVILVAALLITCIYVILKKRKDKSGLESPLQERIGEKKSISSDNEELEVPRNVDIEKKSPGASPLG